MEVKLLLIVVTALTLVSNVQIVDILLTCVILCIYYLKCNDISFHTERKLTWNTIK